LFCALPIRLAVFELRVKKVAATILEVSVDHWRPTIKQHQVDQVSVDCSANGALRVELSGYRLLLYRALKMTRAAISVQC
jgi:hypothetical protein